MRPSAVRSPSLARLYIPSLIVVALAPFCDSVPPPASPSRPRTVDGQDLLDQDPYSSLLSRRAAVVDPDDKYIPARIGGIVGSYALSLLIVGLLLLVLSKRRRERLQNSCLPDELGLPLGPIVSPRPAQGPGTASLKPAGAGQPPPLELQIPGSPHRNFSRPSASPGGPGPAGLSPQSLQSSFVTVSPVSTIVGPGRDLAVDQAVVQRDKVMAQSQLEEMYRYVLEHDEARAEGREYVVPLPSPTSSDPPAAAPSSFLHRKKDKPKNKPSTLNLNSPTKRSSGSSSGSSPSARGIFSFLRTPRKPKTPRAMAISSPMAQTPRSSAFPGNPYDQRGSNDALDAQYPITPRHYASIPPPPLPTNAAAVAAGDGQSVRSKLSHASLPTPDMSPVAAHQSIDAALGGLTPAPLAVKPAVAPDSPKSATTPLTARRDNAVDPQEPLRSPLEEDAGQKDRDVGDRPDADDDDQPLASPVSPGALPEPLSAKSDDSSTSHTNLLVGLPTSPRPGVGRFPSRDSLVPASPRPQQQQPGGFFFGDAATGASTGPSDSGNGERSNLSLTALRLGGQLPLRAYEQAGGPLSPTSAEAQRSGRNIQQTVFTRASYISGGGPRTAGLRTPWTGMMTATPYSPYQPFTPVVPMTPTLVTREDRRRMRRAAPKTPTTAMVLKEEDMW